MNDEPTNPTENNGVNANNPVQTHSDFKAERIIPKKPVEEKGSLFNFRHKNEKKIPQEPTLGSSDSAQPELNLEPEEPVAPITDTSNSTTAATSTTVVEENIPEQSAVVPPIAPKTSWKKPETWRILGRLPAKHRRLVVALLLLIVLLLLVMWLKPSNTTTVAALQNQNSSALPIEFQPLNQPEEEQINSLPEGDSPHTATVVNSDESALEHANVPMPAQPTPIEVQNTPEVAKQPAEPQPAPSVNNNTQTTPPAVIPPKVVSQPVQNAVRKPVSESRKVQPAKPAASKSPQVSKNTPAAPRSGQKAAPVVTAKPAKRARSAANSGPVRTLEIPKGVSLMQVFRNNNLNISDVNAMTKANGANGELSRFKPGDKVRVQLNNQGRVSRLSLESGGTFIRNSDGSYTFKK